VNKKATSEDRELDAVRAAKDKVGKVLAGLAVVNGIGITRKDGRYALKVNVETLHVSMDRMPTSIGGVPIVFSETGKVRKQE